MSEPKKTPLYDLHLKFGAKMVDFGGFLMPVSYGKVLDEHHFVREHVGMFDVSHMGEISVQGPDATKFLDHLTVNRVSSIPQGGSQYTAMCNPQAGVIDDLICYRTGPSDYFLCVNASNADKDFKWLKEQSTPYQVTLVNESNHWAQIAVQGPKSLDVMQNCFKEHKKELTDLNFGHFIAFKEGGLPVMIARTGYTGEKGYEVYLHTSLAAPLWEKLAQEGVKPIGLGARDTLRLEACYMLHGNDMDETISPLEAGIGWTVSLDKGDFIGRSTLVTQKESGKRRHMHAFIMTEQAIPRSHMTVFKDGKPIGVVTSGSVLPSLSQNGGLCLLEEPLKEGTSLFIDVRGKQKEAKIAKKPLYKARTKD